MDPWTRIATRPAKVSASSKKRIPSILEAALEGVIVEELALPTTKTAASVMATLNVMTALSTISSPTATVSTPTTVHQTLAAPPPLSVMPPPTSTVSMSTSLHQTVAAPTRTQLKTSSGPHLSENKQTSNIQAPKLSPSPHSSTFLEFQDLRRRCNLSRTPCTYTFVRGSKKGVKCGKPSMVCNVVCSQHMQKPQVTTLYTSAVRPTKLRINTLKRNKRYFFVRICAEHSVILQRKEKLYILKLPRGMSHPEQPTKRHYLIRDYSNQTVWCKAPKKFCVL